jgi:hypothetical protein
MGYENIEMYEQRNILEHELKKIQKKIFWKQRTNDTKIL